MTTLSHPNIIQLYEIFDDKRRLYVVMELERPPMDPPHMDPP